MRWLFMILAVIVLLSGCVCPDAESWADRFDRGAGPGITVAYIPLDNRPVNTDRVMYLAQAAGVRLLMPQEHLYRTALDGQSPNPNGTQFGDGQQLLAWLEETEADYYVVSVDQILSGGLVNSRWMTELTEGENSIDRLFAVLEGKQAIFLDTVMRLSPTVGYGGCTLEEYQTLRSYGSLPRVSLDGEITLERVVDGYGVESTVDSVLLNRYHSARHRKLTLTVRLLEKLKGKDNFCYLCGVDDSSPRNTIQTNEIALIRQNMHSGALFAGTDELGLMGVARILRSHYAKDSEISAGIHYFGADPSAPADGYDMGSLEENLLGHLAALNIMEDTDGNVEILVFGGDSPQTAQTLVDKCKENAANKRPTIVIDLGESSVLVEALLADEDAQPGMLLGYSSWNTAGNAVGIALANGIGRFCYLQYGQEAVAGANAAFLEGLAYSFGKDVSYQQAKPQLDAFISSRGSDSGNFGQQEALRAELGSYALALLNREEERLSFACFGRKLEGTPFLTSLAPYRTAQIPAIVLTAVDFPWCRTFEAELEIQIG